MFIRQQKTHFKEKMKMDKKMYEAFAQALSFIEIIPSFDGAILFSDELADIIGFQIKGDVNNAGRMVFSVQAHNEGEINYDEAVNIFKEKYQELHGNSIRELGKHDIHTPSYPSTGADYIEDISPATITQILRISLENDTNDMDGVFSAYIMRLTQEISRWYTHFEKITQKTKILKECFEKILENSL